MIQSVAVHAPRNATPRHPPPLGLAPQAGSLRCCLSATAPTARSLRAAGTASTPTLPAKPCRLPATPRTGRRWPSGRRRTTCCTAPASARATTTARSGRGMPAPRVSGKAGPGAARAPRAARSRDAPRLVLCWLSIGRERRVCMRACMGQRCAACRLRWQPTPGPYRSSYLPLPLRGCACALCGHSMMVVMMMVHGGWHERSAKAPSLPGPPPCTPSIKVLRPFHKVGPSRPLRCLLFRSSAGTRSSGRRGCSRAPSSSPSPGTLGARDGDAQTGRQADTQPWSSLQWHAMPRDDGP